MSGGVTRVRAPRAALGFSCLVVVLLATAGTLLAHAAATPVRKPTADRVVPVLRTPARHAHTAAHPQELPALGLSSWNTYLADAASGGSPWNPGTGGGSGINPGGFNAEYFQPDHVTFTATGLTIDATAGSSRPGYQYTSGVVSSYGHQSFDGGTIEVQAQMPDTTGGAWPCIWLLGAPGDEQNDEIDLFEGGLTSPEGWPNEMFSGYVHTDGHDASIKVNVGTDLAAGVHTYGITWIPGKSVTWLFDGRVVGELTSARIRIPSAPLSLVMSLSMATSAAGGWHTVADGSGSASMHILRVTYQPLAA